MREVIEVRKGIASDAFAGRVLPVEEVTTAFNPNRSIFPIAEVLAGEPV
jgi:hypothetical protein